MIQEKLLSPDSTELAQKNKIKKVLCVDDEIDNLDAIERILRKKYQVLKASSGQKALDLLRSESDISVIVTDQRMPEMTGVEFLQKSLLSHPDTSRILLTGYTDLESVIAAVNEGQVQRYLTKPWDPTDLGLAVDQAFERYSLSIEIKTKNIQLAQALAAIQELDRMKSEFMILINHELKTPLTNIINFTSLLTESTLNDEQKMFTGKLMKSANKLRHIVDDCMLIIKALSRQLLPKRQNYVWTDLHGLLGQDTQNLMKKKQVTLQGDLQSLTWNTDPLLLGEILKRLLNNAVKFSLENKAIEVSLKKTDRGEEIQIFNEGPPFDESKKSNLFKPFFIDENVMNHSQGLGLGLAVSQAVAEALGLKVDIMNTPNGVQALVFKA